MTRPGAPTIAWEPREYPNWDEGAMDYREHRTAAPVPTQLWAARLDLPVDAPMELYELVAERIQRQLEHTLRSGWEQVGPFEVSEEYDRLTDSNTLTVKVRIRETWTGV